MTAPANRQAGTPKAANSHLRLFAVTMVRSQAVPLVVTNSHGTSPCASIRLRRYAIRKRARNSSSKSRGQSICLGCNWHGITNNPAGGFRMSARANMLSRSTGHRMPPWAAKVRFCQQHRPHPLPTPAWPCMRRLQTLQKQPCDPGSYSCACRPSASGCLVFSEFDACPANPDFQLHNCPFPNKGYMLQLLSTKPTLPS